MNSLFIKLFCGFKLIVFMAMCVYKYVFISTLYIVVGGGCQARFQVFIIEGRPVLAKGRGTVYVPSASRGKGQGLLKLLGIRNMRSL